MSTKDYEFGVKALAKSDTKNWENMDGSRDYNNLNLNSLWKPQKLDIVSKIHDNGSKSSYKNYEGGDAGRKFHGATKNYGLGTVKSPLDKGIMKSKESDKKGYSSSSTNLKLHIEAYVDSEEYKVDNKTPQILTKSNINRWKNVNKAAECSHHFEIPRQQNDRKLDPEVMQFKASQKLFNPNNGPTEMSPAEEGLIGPEYEFALMLSAKEISEISLMEEKILSVNHLYFEEDRLFFCPEPFCGPNCVHYTKRIYFDLDKIKCAFQVMHFLCFCSRTMNIVPVIAEKIHFTSKIQELWLNRQQLTVCELSLIGSKAGLVSLTETRVTFSDGEPVGIDQYFDVLKEMTYLNLDFGYDHCKCHVFDMERFVDKSCKLLKVYVWNFDPDDFDIRNFFKCLKAKKSATLFDIRVRPVFGEDNPSGNKLADEVITEIIDTQTFDDFVPPVIRYYKMDEEVKKKLEEIQKENKKY